MKTTTPETASRRIESATLTPTALFELLANDRRRYVLHYLSQRIGAVSLDDLIEQVARWEDESTRNRRERILTDLHHTHLPKLTDAGVVRYDFERETVELLATADTLADHLQLVTATDLQ